ncbi:MAG: CRISPR-associated endonuclease Cas2 [Bacilli bacterium]
MVIISYDISNDKKRTAFSKYLKKFGYRLQYSVFVIKNSDRVLNNIIYDIDNKFLKTFSQEDSIYIFKINEDKIIKYGYAKNDSDIFIIN